MSRPRKPPTMRDKLASALSHMMIEVDGKLERAIPYEDAKNMSADQVISLFQFDHGILHTWNGSDEHWNLTPRFIREHRAKTKIDQGRVAKVRRIQANTALLSVQTEIDRQERRREKPKRKWPSRPIPKRRKDKRPLHKRMERK